MQLLRNRSEDLLASAHGVLKDTNPQETPLVDLSVHGAGRNEIDDCHCLALLAIAVDPSNALLDPHRIPREVVVDEQIAELEVQALAAHLGGEHHVDRIGILFRQREPSTDASPLLVGNVAVNQGDAQTRLARMGIEVREGVAKGAEDERLVVWSLALVEQHPYECSCLRIMGIKTTCLLEQCLNIGPDLIDGQRIGLQISVYRLHELQLVELAAKNVGKEWCQPIEATGGLSPDCRHHELDVQLSMTTDQYP